VGSTTRGRGNSGQVRIQGEEFLGTNLLPHEPNPWGPIRGNLTPTGGGAMKGKRKLQGAGGGKTTTKVPWGWVKVGKGKQGGVGETA